MTQADIAKIRLSNQHIAGSEFSSPRKLAGWMGAMQAQDYPMSAWAFGIRLPGLDQKKIEEAADRGDILRTHLLRPTWHFVAAENIRWLLRISAPRLKASMNGRLAELGIDEHMLEKSTRLLRDNLRNGNHLTREELVILFSKAGLSADSSQSYHMMVRAELDGVICSGRISGKKQTYALLDERVPNTDVPTNEEALGKLAGIYFSSHGPATQKDFAWWSGLTAADTRTAISVAKPELISSEIDSITYWMKKDFIISRDDVAYLLPAFDEFIISYTDRSAVLSQLHNSKAVSDNGFFRPVILLNGQAAGLWKRTLKGEMVIIETNLFRKHGRTVKKAIEKAAAGYGKFLGKQIEVLHLK